VPLNRWFSRGSIVEAMHWMVLHRPVELAALAGHLKSAGAALQNFTDVECFPSPVV
jgi:hypothetical protein